MWKKEKVTGRDLWFGYHGASSHMLDVQEMNLVEWENYNVSTVHMLDTVYVRFF
jgi:hypothetical protein